ncbi:hypothetical protein D3C87_1944270 [compost metagenome]
MAMDFLSSAFAEASAVIFFHLAAPSPVMYMVTSGLPSWLKSERASLMASPPRSGLPSKEETLMAYSSKILAVFAVPISAGLALHMNL